MSTYSMLCGAYTALEIQFMRKLGAKNLCLINGCLANYGVFCLCLGFYNMQKPTENEKICKSIKVIKKYKERILYFLKFFSLNFNLMKFFSL